MKLAIIGIGKMGGAFLQGIINKGKYTKNELLLICHQQAQKDNLLKEGYQVSLNVEDAYNCDLILLSIKPQKFPEVLVNTSKYDFSSKVIISIAAGISLETLNSYFKGATILRAMPTTSALINSSVTTMCANKNNDKYLLGKEILESVGLVVEIKENQMDETLPLNGSMPAYIYLFIKSFVDAAVKDGIEEEKAKLLACSTIMASSKMALSSKDDLQTLIDNVCSKGGTTIAGLNRLYENNVPQAIEECYTYCKNRSKELNKK